MAESRNTFIGGMNQDRSPDKYDNTQYYKGINIKVLTEEGLSTGAIENEDGNKISFTIPDTFPIYRIRFDDAETPDVGELQLTFTDPTTGLTSTVTTGNVDDPQDLYEAINTQLASILGTSVKVFVRGIYVYIVCLDANFSAVLGSSGLSNVDGTPFVTSQSGLQIIGWSTLRDEVVLFTTNETSATPSSAGQLWKFKYDAVTKEVIGLVNGELSLLDHYIYNGPLDFSTYWHIGNETVGHYENSSTGRVYWTDEYNVLRSANVLDPELFSVSAGNFGMTEIVNMSIPIVTNVTDGGAIPYGATVQYAYRLFNEGGAVTTFSPVSNPIPLGAFNPSDTGTTVPQNLHWGAHGATSGSGADKAINYTISGIDTSFSIIEHVAIVTTSTGRDIYIFASDNVPGDGTLSVTHNDRGDDIPITEEEFTALTRTFKKCKTITVKDKRLIAGNLSTEDVSIEGYDSRAYRFDSSRQALITDSELDDETIDGFNPDWTAIPDDHDCVNPYNKDDSDVVNPSGTNTAVNQYKFKADGITYGGEGPNISYEFTLQNIPIKKSVTGINEATPATGLYDINLVQRNYQAPVGSYVSLNGERRGHINEHQSFKSPTMAGAFTGYARGEVYRFAIVFYDTEGNPYNAKWIGDIKIPEAYENNGYFGIRDLSVLGAPYFTDFYTGFNRPIMGRSIGITFNVDVSSIQDKISGFEIVRVERTESQRTRLGTGLYLHFNAATTGMQFANRRENNPGGDGTGVQDWPQINVNGTVKTAYTLSDKPGGSFNGHTVGAILHPSMLVGGHSFKSGDKLRTIGYYTDSEGQYESFINVLGAPVMAVNANRTFDHKSLAAVLTLGAQWQPALPNIANEEREITQLAYLAPGQEVSSGESINTLSDSIFNTSPGSFDGSFYTTPAGAGDAKHLVNINNPWVNHGFTNDITSVVFSEATIWWREVSYNRDVINQYGGDSYVARSKNKYISTGSFTDVREYSNTTQTTTVFGGDTTVHQFAYQYFHAWAGDTNLYPQYSGATPLSPQYHLGFNFPCESYINLDYQVDGCYGDTTTILYLGGFLPTATGSFAGVPVPAKIPSMIGPKTYYVPGIYNPNNVAKNIYYPKGFIDNFTTEHPHRLWASEKKLDGELLDSWKIWLPNNYTEVDGQYGQINKITTARDIFHFYQDRAFGAASINDRSVLNDEDGIALTLGSGGILDDYGYISRNTGTTHKFSVVPTGMSIHHYDAILNKWMRYSDGPRPLSDIEGLHSTFRKFNGNFLKSDRILLGSGIHGTFDKVRNEVHMTFLDAQQNLTAGLPDYDYTITFNENLQKYTAFSDRIPLLWLETHGKLLTVGSNLNEGWLEYEGAKNSFYGVVYPSVLELIVAPTADITSVFDTIAYKGEIFLNDIDQANLTLDSLQAVNDHQDTGVITLVPNQNVIRKLRTWRTNIPRDINSPNQDARMRDYYIKLILTHTPNSGEKMVLHDIVTNFRMSPH